MSVGGALHEGKREKGNYENYDYINVQWSNDQQRMKKMESDIRIDCEYHGCHYKTDCINCILNHYVSHYANDYLASLTSIKCTEQVKHKIDDLTAKKDDLRHTDEFVYQYRQFMHPAFWLIKDQYDNGE